jgi:SNF family Na+-dependent transporter
VTDLYPVLRKRRKIFVGLLFGFYLIVGLPSCMSGGYYVVEFLDRFAAGYSILIAVFFENIAAAWVYGNANMLNFRCLVIFQISFISSR